MLNWISPGTKALFSSSICCILPGHKALSESRAFYEKLRFFRKDSCACIK